MTIEIVGNIKGGAGKTTVATNLACIAGGPDIGALQSD
jgi:cellulose biosynthesis protein BcsQ